MYVSKMVDLPIISMDCGQAYGKTAGWLLCSSGDRLLCLLAAPLKWYDSVSCIPADGVIGIADAVMIRTGSSIRPPREISGIDAAHIGTGSEGFSPKGERIGIICDMFIDSSGIVTHYLLNTGEKLSPGRIFSSGGIFIASRSDGPVMLNPAQNDITAISFDIGLDINDLT